MPVIIKPNRLGILTKIEPKRGGGTYVVSAFGLFRLDDPSDFLSDQVLWPLATKALPPGTPLDIGSPKVQAEVLVSGHAVPPDGRPASAMTVAVAIGSVAVELAVFGDRYWMPARTGAVFTEPKPFTALPLHPDHAFGGPGHPSNAAGRGFRATARMEAGEPVLLPNVEWLHAPVRSIDDTPKPALVGPLDLMNPGRTKLAGTYDMHWLKHYHPGLAPDHDPRLFNLAPEPQRLAGFLRGDETFRAVGFSPRSPDIRGALPGFRLRCFVDRGGVFELETRIDTLWFIAGEGVGILTYRAAVPVEDVDGLDVKAVLIAYERMSETPRPVGHYADLIRSRLAREMKSLMIDPKLSPEIDPQIKAEQRRRREEYTLALRERHRDAMVFAAKRQLEEQGLPADLVPDFPLPEPPPFPIPTMEEFASGEADLSEIIEGLETMTRENEKRFRPLREIMEREGLAALLRDPARALELLAPDQGAEAAAALREGSPGEGIATLLASLPAGAPDRVRAELDSVAAFSPPDLGSLISPEAGEEDAFSRACAAFESSAGAAILGPAQDGLAGIDPALLPPAARQPGASTSFAAGLDDLLAMAPQAGPALTAALGPTPLARPGEADPMARLLGAFRDPGQTQGDPEGGVIAAIEAARRQVEQAHEQLDQGLGQLRRQAPQPTFPLQPLTGAAAQRFGAYIIARQREGLSLAGRDLAGADLRGVDWAGLDLTGTFLEKADLREARLAGVKAVSAVFAGARLDGADLGGADLSGANLGSCSARGARFAGAAMGGIAGFEADFQGADLSGASLADASLIRARLTGASLRAASLARLSVLESSFDFVDASDAILSFCNFLQVRFEGVRFAGARLERCGFMQCALPGADFTGAALVRSGFAHEIDLTGARFDGVEARRASFMGAGMAGASFERANFIESGFLQSDLVGASFRLANLSRAMLDRADLSRSDFFGAHLFEARLRRAILTGASFRAANLYSAKLNEADLRATDLTGSNLAMTMFGLETDAA